MSLRAMRNGVLPSRYGSWSRWPAFRANLARNFCPTPSSGRAATRSDAPLVATLRSMHGASGKRAGNERCPGPTPIAHWLTLQLADVMCKYGDVCGGLEDETFTHRFAISSGLGSGNSVRRDGGV